MPRPHSLALRTARFVGLVAVVLAVVVFGADRLGFTVFAAPEDRIGHWRAEWEAFGQAAPDGFVAWESNRDGRWRIWRRGLDGSGLARLTPDEPGRDHFCPHVAPDGRRVAFLSVPVGVTCYEPFPAGCDARLCLIDRDGSVDSVAVVGPARAYFEDRAALWVDASTLIHIDGDGRTVRVDVDRGERRVLIATPAERHGWLVNATGTHADTGWATFSEFDTTGSSDGVGRVLPGPRLGGCQPYFSSDGVWGFWIGSTGGPIYRYHLATGRVDTVLDRWDERLPRSRRYLYFPMISTCQRLLAFGASTGQHDHFTADYDVFVAPIDPVSLELRGRPVRYTFDAGTDRFPDVFFGALELGRRHGEAPLSVVFPRPDDSVGWRWSWGDGSVDDGAAGRHRYGAPGDYVVEARSSAGEVRRGHVVVREGSPPRAVAVSRRGVDALAVRFDEPVRLAATATARLEIGGIEARTVRVAGPDGCVVRVEFAAAVPSAADEMILTGVTDRAETPNALPATPLALAAAGWPGVRDALVFSVADLATPGRVPDATRPGEERSFVPAPRGRAHADRAHRMVCSGGGYAVGDAALGAQLAAAGAACTIELSLRAARPWANEKGAVVVAVGDADGTLVQLDQRKDRFWLTVGSAAPVDVAPVKTFVEQRMALTIDADGQLTSWVDGARERFVAIARDPDDLSRWSALSSREDLVVTFGGERRADGGWGRSWFGTLAHVAIHARALTEHEVDLDRARAEARSASADAPIERRRVVGARLVATSAAPSLVAIAPYRDALVVHEYELPPVGDEAGENGGPGSAGARRETVRVVHWGLLDGQLLPAAKRRVGGTFDLELEPLDAQPQLRATYVADDLEDDFDAVYWHDTRMPGQ